MSDTASHRLSPQNRLCLTVDEENAGQRLDKALAEMVSDVASRESIQQWIKASHVLVNGRCIVKVAHRVAEGDAIAVDIPPETPLDLVAENIPLEVIYEDDSVLVVNKPVGMLTHPAGSQLTGTLVNAILHHCNGNLSDANGPIRPGIVHRLDRDTSGLMMVAKTNAAHRGLAEQLHSRTAGRTYVAITHGLPPTPTGTIQAALARNPKKRNAVIVDETGRHAVTHWQVLDTVHSKYAKVQFKLETGRTHQIRVHCAHKGFPIIGDPLYGNGVEKQLRLSVSGQLLQAVRLQFTHPVTGQSMDFEIPESELLCKGWASLINQ